MQKGGKIKREVERKEGGRKDKGRHRGEKERERQQEERGEGGGGGIQDMEHEKPDYALTTDLVQIFCVCGTVHRFQFIAPVAGVK